MVERTLDMSTPIFFSSYASHATVTATVETLLPTPPIEPPAERFFG